MAASLACASPRRAGASPCLAAASAPPPPVAQDTDEAHAARDRLLQRRFGYKPLPIETLVEWRAEIPEYHKSLVGGHALLERPLQAPRAR